MISKEFLEWLTQYAKEMGTIRKGLHMEYNQILLTWGLI